MFGQHPCKGKAPFLRAVPNSHKKVYTTCCDKHCEFDGYTIKVRGASGQMTVRLVGIDAPESSHKKREPGESFPGVQLSFT
jgi:endonuclease YncB( thermonuclease family)